MKVKTKIMIFGLVLLGIIALLSVGIFNKVEHKKKVKENILTLGSIQYLSTDSLLHGLTLSDRSKVIFFFNSECEHCQREARLISSEALSLANSDVYFFSTEELLGIKRFADEFGLTKRPEFEIGKVAEHVAHEMGVITYPMCYIYSAEGKLLKKYVGEVKIEAITKYLQ